MLFVVPAGNDAENLDDEDASCSFPRDFRKLNPKEHTFINRMIIVGAYDERNGTLEWYSSFGKTMVDVGEARRFEPGDGTSYAALFVSHVAAEIKAVNTQFSPEEISGIIKATVDCQEGLRNLVKTGGIVNRTRAIEMPRRLSPLKNQDQPIPIPRDVCRN